MDFIIYITLLILSMTFIVLGYKLKDNADIFKVVGFSFLFILSVMLIPGTPGALEYPVGSEIVETSTGHQVTDITDTYESYTIGVFLSLASIFGFINVYVSRGGSGGFGQND
jgi:hypothetical protein